MPLGSAGQKKLNLPYLNNELTFKCCDPELLQFYAYFCYVLIKLFKCNK